MLSPVREGLHYLLCVWTLLMIKYSPQKSGEIHKHTVEQYSLSKALPIWLSFSFKTDSPSHTCLYRVRAIHPPGRGLILSLIIVWVSFWFRDCDSFHDFLSYYLSAMSGQADTQVSGLRKWPGWGLEGGSELTVELTVNLSFRKCSQSPAEGQDVGVAYLFSYPALCCCPNC